MRSYHQLRKSKKRHAAVTQPPYTPQQMAKLYGFPTLLTPLPTPRPLTLIELGGGYSASQITQQFQNWHLPAPHLADLVVQGATNQYTGNPNGADGEVVLDIVVAAGAYAAMTGRAADVRVIFAPNTDAGFIEAVALAGSLGAGACGISWGAPEDQWGPAALGAMNTALQQGVARGMIYCCASGDAGASDGEQGLHVDFPGSSPAAICCGGTSIVASIGVLTNEVPWNAHGGAAGGGYSASQMVPPWQVGFVPSGQKRGVPDLVAMADPVPGWATPFGGIGGTSAVAPFLAALACVLREFDAQRDFAAFLYANESNGFRDVVVGNLSPYSATKGWDAASGLGSPLGNALLQAWRSSSPPPPPPPPPTGHWALALPGSVSVTGPNPPPVITAQS